MISATGVVQDEVERAVDQPVNIFRQYYEAFREQLPEFVAAIVVGAALIVAALVVAQLTERALARTRADRVAVGLLARITRLLLILAALLFALAVAGVPVGTALGALAVAGVAVGLAVQGILENFIAGVILLVRKPFSAGHQIRTGEHEGTVEDIDLRVTRLVDYDGKLILIPNRDVYTNVLINITTRGKRRTCVMVGVDYRDDHDEARRVIRAALTGVDGVLDDPEPEVLFTELGESSVNFEVRYWTAPDIRSVRHAQDRVLSAVKRGLEDAGMTIPWPIRTLVPDGRFRVQTESGD